MTFTQHLGLHDHMVHKMVRYHAERKNAHHHSLGLLVLSFGMTSKGHDFDCGAAAGTLATAGQGPVIQYWRQ